MSIGWIEVIFAKAEKGTEKVSGENVSSFSFVSFSFGATLLATSVEARMHATFD